MPNNYLPYIAIAFQLMLLYQLDNPNIQMMMVCVMAYQIWKKYSA